MKIHYYFDMHEFNYEVDDAEIEQRFGKKPKYYKDIDKWYNEIEEYYEDAARYEAKRISDENESALEDLKDSYMRSV